MSHAAQRSLVAVVHKWYIETIHPRDLISAKCQQPQSQNNVDVVNHTTQRSSSERMTARHTETTPKTKPSHVPGQPGSSVESLHEVFRFKDEAMGESPKREVPQSDPKNSHPRGLFGAKLHPTKSSPKGLYKPQSIHYMKAVQH